jgi:hypothetical protein
MPSRGGQAAPQDPDVITAVQLADWLGFRTAQAVRDATVTGAPGGGEADGIPGMRVGHEFRYSRRAVYEWIAGPGVPDGEILDATELGRRIGASSLLVRRSAAPPGTPGKIPGRRVGKKQWRFALEAVRAAIGGTVPGAGAPEGAQRS